MKNTIESDYYNNPNTKIISLKLNVYIDHGLKRVILMIALTDLVRVCVA